VGETCEGNACPATCADNNACTVDSLVGSRENCSASCVYQGVSQCRPNDGCCPAGCTTAQDNDCSTTCGNNQVEGTEVCDGNCPSSCDDSNACTRDVATGSAAQCSLRCGHQAITACQAGDGCCPAGCSAALDSDCGGGSSSSSGGTSSSGPSMGCEVTQPNTTLSGATPFEFGVTLYGDICPAGPLYWRWAEQGTFAHNMRFEIGLHPAEGPLPGGWTFEVVTSEEIGVVVATLEAGNCDTSTATSSISCRYRIPASSDGQVYVRATPRSGAAAGFVLWSVSRPEAP